MKLLRPLRNVLEKLVKQHKADSSLAKLEDRVMPYIAIEEYLLLSKLVTDFGADVQLNIVVEELAELIQAITKVKRQSEVYFPKAKIRDNLLEEYVDVRIMLSQLEIIYPYLLEGFEAVKNSKMDKIRTFLSNYEH